MKASIIMAVLVVIIFGVSESEADCSSSCSGTCYNRGCTYYAAAIRDGKCYCCCFKCGSDNFFKVGHVQDMTPRDEFNEEMLMEIQNHKH